MTEENIKRKVLRLSIIGDSKTGKTSIINCFIGEEFSMEMISNIGIDKQETMMKMEDGSQIKVIIWDTAGQERFHSISSGTIKNSQGIIVCFALDDRNSFNNVLSWLQDVREINSKIPIALFGNKCDIIEGRKVQNHEAQNLANDNDLMYFETSAKDNINIKEGFTKLINESYKNATFDNKIKLGKKMQTKKKKCC